MTTVTKDQQNTSIFDKYANGVYNKSMEFIETPIFTRLITELLPDDDYRLLQTELVEDP